MPPAKWMTALLRPPSKLPRQADAAADNDECRRQPSLRLLAPTTLHSTAARGPACTAANPPGAHRYRQRLVRRRPSASCGTPGTGQWELRRQLMGHPWAAQPAHRPSPSAAVGEHPAVRMRMRPSLPLPTCAARRCRSLPPTGHTVDVPPSCCCCCDVTPQLCRPAALRSTVYSLMLLT